jgi:uncharacterized repeat protein (TIGR01451 family)
VTLATVVGIALAALAGPLLSKPETASAAATGCGYANTSANNGKFAQTACWLNFSTFTETAARSASGQLMSVTLDGGYTANFTVKMADVPGDAVMHVLPQTTPLAARFAFGTDAYRGVPGSPALYSQPGTGFKGGVLSFSNITVKDSAGNPVTGFSFVAADAEDLVGGTANESFTWSSDKPLNEIERLAPTGNWGCKSPIGLGTTTVSCNGTGTGGSTAAGGKSTALLVAADSPTQFNVEWQTNAQSGIAIAIRTARLTLTKQVTSRTNAADAFTLNVTSPRGTNIATASTGAASTATTGPVTVLPVVGDGPFVLSESAAGGSPTVLSNYSQSWACTNANTGSTTVLPSGGGTTKNVTPAIGDDIACTVTNAALPAAITLVKHAGTANDVNGDGITDTGDTIPYTFTVSNSGQTTLQNLVVTDAKVGAVTCPTTNLAPTVSTTCTATTPYTVTADDAAAGLVTNTASASANAAGAATIQSPPSTATVPLTTPRPAIALEKTASPNDAASFAVGNTVNYSFKVTNTGNTIVHGVGITEVAFNGATPLIVSCPSGSIAPGASATCTAGYTYVLADVNRGTLDNTAHATALDGYGSTVTSNDSTVGVPADRVPSLTLVKAASPTTVTAAGQTIDYSFLITNTGNVTINSIAVTEQGFTGSGTAPTASCPVTTLNPTTSTTCTASYVATQADIDAGGFSNTAVAAGVSTGGPATSNPSTATVASNATASLALIKSVTPTSGAAAGDQVEYSFLITNTGDVTVSGTQVIEGAFSGTGVLPVTCPAAVALMAPGAGVTCTAPYQLTQADVDAGTVTNAATASGTRIDTAAPVISPASNATVTIAHAPALTMVKTVTPSTDATLGTALVYSFAITNAGNVTLHGLGATEMAFTGTGTLSAISCPATTLAPTAHTTCTATYTVTAADVRRGTIDNTAAGTALSPDGDPVTSGPSTAHLTLAAVTAAAGLALTGLDYAAIVLVPIGAVATIAAGSVILVVRRRRRSAR